MYIGGASALGAMREAMQGMAASMQKISSFDRIPAAQYDPSGLAISERFEASRRGYDMMAMNAEMEMQSNATAEAALGQIQDSVQRMHELSVQASNGTLTGEDRGIIQMEIDALKENINEIAENTQFNNKQLIVGYSADALGLGGLSVIGDAGGAITAATEAIDTISEGRTAFGSAINAAEKSISNLQSQSLAALRSYDTIRGLDIAQELVELTKNQMLFEAGAAMLKTEQDMRSSLISLIK